MDIKTSGIVLAGGFSRRMGTDKALLPVGAAPSYAHVVRALAAVADDIYVVRREDQDALSACPGQKVRVVCDLRPGAGPLAGMEAGLAHVRHDWAFVLAGDTPLVKPALLKLLQAQLSEAAAENPRLRALILRKGGAIHPLLGIYHKALQGELRGLLDADRRRVKDLLARVPVCELPETIWGVADPLGESLLMMNTRDEYDRVCRRMEGGSAL